jgi:CheY-like chemotaxis protein
VKLLLAKAPDQSVAVPSERRILGYEGPRRTVIVVDDNPAHRDLMQEILSPLGFVLFTAADGVSCLALAGQCEPDLIFLDIAMHGLSGWQTAQRLRESGHARPAVIILSANVGDFRDGAVLHNYHEGMLAKPFELQQLLDQMQQMLKLEWVYEAKDIVAPVVAAAAGLMSPLDFPAKADIAELQRLGRIGHIKAIEAKLDQIHARNPNTSIFTSRLRGLIKDFDFRRYMAVLQEVHRHDS